MFHVKREVSLAASDRPEPWTAQFHVKRGRTTHPYCSTSLMHGRKGSFTYDVTVSVQRGRGQAGCRSPSHKSRAFGAGTTCWGTHGALLQSVTCTEWDQQGTLVCKDQANVQLNLSERLDVQVDLPARCDVTRSVKWAKPGPFWTVGTHCCRHPRADVPRETRDRPSGSVPSGAGPAEHEGMRQRGVIVRRGKEVVPCCASR